MRSRQLRNMRTGFCYDSGLRSALINDMKRLFMMCGIAFSGKTTVAKQLVRALGCAYVSLDDINAERGLHGGDGIAVEEWERTHGVAIERMKHLMARGEYIVLDDTNCFRWLRDKYSEFASENGYVAELVYLAVSLEEVQERIVRNTITTARHSIESNVFGAHVQEFEPPQADEVTTVLRNAEDVSRWIETTRRQS
jgi:predicted kinase